MLNAANMPAADESSPRRPWQWVGFGALAVVTVWIPLAGVATVLASHLAPSGTDLPASAGIAILAVYGAALALGAVLGGFLVGRWGPAGVGVREAALAGLVAAGVAALGTWISMGPSAGAWLVMLLATPTAALGGRLGMRGRLLRP